MSEQNPYQTPAADFGSGEVAASENALASPWIRLLASIIDTLILLVFILPFQIYIGVFDGYPDKIVPPDFQTTMMISVLAIFIYAAINGYTLYKNGQTLGKLICKIKIVKTSFEYVSFARIIFARYLPMSFISQLPFVGWVISLADVLFIFRKDRQCLHDKIAGTVVIKA